MYLPCTTGQHTLLDHMECVAIARQRHIRGHIEAHVAGWSPRDYLVSPPQEVLNTLHIPTRRFNKLYTKGPWTEFG